jgi:hypothetical protein
VNERAGLTVVTADPWSGTTGLLEELRVEAKPPDARGCIDAGDLGMAIADEAVRTFTQEAAASWPRPASPDIDARFLVAANGSSSILHASATTAAPRPRGLRGDFAIHTCVAY